MASPASRERIIEALHDLPTDATFDDAIERLLFLAKVDAGLAEMRSVAANDMLADLERTSCLIVLVLLAALSGCGSSSPSSASGPSSASSSPTSGRIEDAQAARDIIEWNMNAEGGASFRRRDVICRRELPAPVYLQGEPDSVRSHSHVHPRSPGRLQAVEGGRGVAERRWRSTSSAATATVFERFSDLTESGS